MVVRYILKAELTGIRSGLDVNMREKGESE